MLQNEPKMPQAIRASIAKDIARGMDYLHSVAKISHRGTICIHVSIRFNEFNSSDILIPRVIVLSANYFRFEEHQRNGRVLAFSVDQ